MDLVFKSQYRNARTGNLVFVYKVNGTESELEDYTASKGEYAVEDDDGAPLFFTTRFVGKNCKMIVTANGNFVPDTSELDTMSNLAATYGGNLGDQIAKGVADKLLGIAPAAPAAPSVPASQSAEPQQAPSDADSGLDDSAS